MATVLNLDEHRKKRVSTLSAFGNRPRLVQHANEADCCAELVSSRRMVDPVRVRDTAQRYIASAAAMLSAMGENERRVSWLLEDCLTLLVKEQFISESLSSEK